MRYTVILSLERHWPRRPEIFYKEFDGNPFDVDWSTIRRGDVEVLAVDGSSDDLAVRVLDIRLNLHEIYCETTKRPDKAAVAQLHQMGFWPYVTVTNIGF
jgi:hypothetical protein